MNARDVFTIPQLLRRFGTKRRNYRLNIIEMTLVSMFIPGVLNVANGCGIIFAGCNNAAGVSWE
jgi:hypothetical protein